MHANTNAVAPYTDDSEMLDVHGAKDAVHLHGRLCCCREKADSRSGEVVRAYPNGIVSRLRFRKHETTRAVEEMQAGHGNKSDKL